MRPGAEVRLGAGSRQVIDGWQFTSPRVSRPDAQLAAAGPKGENACQYLPLGFRDGVTITEFHAI